MAKNKKEVNFEPLAWIFAGVALFAILAGFFLVVEPFLAPLTWSGIIVLSTWPIYVRLRHFLPRRPKLASFLMSLSVALVFILAVTPVLVSLSGEAETAARALRSGIVDGTFRRSLETMPAFGPRLQKLWDTYLGNGEALLHTLSGFQDNILVFATSAARGVASGLLTFLVVVILSFFLYRDGLTIALQIKRIAVKFGGDRAEHLLLAVRDTVKGAVYGLLLTAFAQGTLAGLGYSVSGVPNPVLLGFTTMVFSLIPLGTPLIYLPAAGYLAFQGDTMWALALAGWGVGIVSMSDNILRPYFVSQSTQMPILLSIIGVIGGLLAFGFLGLFIGPVLVAVVIALWREWLHEI